MSTTLICRHELRTAECVFCDETEMPVRRGRQSLVKARAEAVLKALKEHNAPLTMLDLNAATDLDNQQVGQALRFLRLSLQPQPENVSAGWRKMTDGEPMVYVYWLENLIEGMAPRVKGDFSGAIKHFQTCQALLSSTRVYDSLYGRSNFRTEDVMRDLEYVTHKIGAMIQTLSAEQE